MSNVLKKARKKENPGLIILIKINENSDGLRIAYKYIAKKMLEDKKCEQQPI